MKNSFLVVSVLSASLFTTAVRGEKNPVMWADVPDPAICCDGRDYYLCSTTMHFMPGVPIMKSHDLVHWETVSYVVPRMDYGEAYDLLDGKSVYGHGQWAPSMRYHKGKFWVWFVCNGLGRGFLYVADKAEGPWRLFSRPPYRHDGSLFFDDDGRTYIFHGSGSITELNDTLDDVRPGGIDGQAFVRDADEQGLLEGSAVFKHDGKYYWMMISMDWSVPGRLRREVCYRSESIKGPWTKKVILEKAYEGFGGVGQGSMTLGPDGKWHAIIFQDRGAVGRVPNLMSVEWVDGWPMIGDPHERFGDKSVDESPVQWGILGSDEFNDSRLKLHWQFNHNPIDSAWSLAERNGWLRLRTSRIVDNVIVAPNTLTQRMCGPGCDGTIRLDVSHMKPGDRAGISAFQSDAGTLAVEAGEKGERRLVMCREESVFGGNRSVKSVNRRVLGEVELEASRLKEGGGCVYLKCAANVSKAEGGAYFSWSYDGKEWRPIGESVSLRFDWERFFVGSRFAIFNYATKEDGGFVDVDWFRFAIDK